MSLIIELTPSEQWGAKQVGDALAGAQGRLSAVEKELADAGSMKRAAEDYATGFVQSVLAAHKKIDPGTIPTINKSDIGIRLTWPDPPPPPKPTVVVPTQKAKTKRGGKRG